MFYAVIKREEAKGSMVACPCCGTVVDAARIKIDLLKDSNK